ncbi:hypothetical protein [Sphingomonas montanisoli]|nr:hypothetical protein [Sphingomonas montanisoli]
MLAASVHAFVAGEKVAGIYDHSANRHLRIAAEARGNHLQGYDDDRSIRFGGTLPELFDTGDKVFISLLIEGSSAQGYDRGSSGFYTVNVVDRLVQLYDHSRSEWFAFSIQIA